MKEILEKVAQYYTSTITLRHKEGLKTEVFASPVELKSNGQLYRGFIPTFIPKGEEDKYAMIPSYDTRVSIKDGTVLDPTDPFDAITIGWLLSPHDPKKTHPYVALKSEDINSKPTAMFFVENKEKASAMKVSRERKVSKLKTQIFDYSNEQKIKLAKALGNQNAEHYSVSSLEEYLINQVELYTDRIELLIANESQINKLAFVRDLIKFKVIEKRKAGSSYVFGDVEPIAVGLDEELVADFLSKPENKEIFDSIKLVLQEKKKLAVA